MRLQLTLCRSHLISRLSLQFACQNYLFFFFHPAPSEDFDADGDGKLTKKEVTAYLMSNMQMLKMLMADQPAQLKRITKSLKGAAKDIFDKADKDKSGDVSRDESVTRPPPPTPSHPLPPRSTPASTIPCPPNKIQNGNNV